MLMGKDAQARERGVNAPQVSWRVWPVQEAQGYRIMISRLLIEHDHIQRTLNLLEMQFLEVCRGETPDYSIMLSIVVYIQEYPEQTHHPLEDAVYSILLRRGGEEGKLARELIKDHTELEGITRRLRGSLEVIASKGICNKEELQRELSNFLARQRRHLHAEEMNIYPLIKAVVTDRDWQAIASTVPHRDDPVFGERTRSDYERLYREIESRNG